MYIWSIYHCKNEIKNIKMDILDFENSTYSVNLRKLTKKSRLGFGYNSIKHITIQDILIMNKHKDLIKIYYGLGKINLQMTSLMN